MPEVVWLEPEQIEQAKAISDRSTSEEAQQWQSYLNALALLGFEQWLSDRLPEQSIQRLSRPIESVCYVEVRGFTVCLIAVEHVLDETVKIHQTVVDQPELAAHFYVVHEVSEEQELVTVRGFCHYDELMNYRDRPHYQIQEGHYQLPLSFLDAEPNHLLFYCRALTPTSISLPVIEIAVNQLLIPLTNTTTRLTRWLQGAFEQNWQAIDQLINPEANLSFSTRSIESGARRGKLINLGLQLGQQTVALLVNVTAEAEGKLGVLVQLHPTGESRYLMANLKLSLQTTPLDGAPSQANRVLQEVTSRSQDNYIQLKPFRGAPGTRFSVAIHLGNETVVEDFELWVRLNSITALSE